MTHKSEELKQNICDAVNILYKEKDKGNLNEDGSAPDSFVESFISLCNLRYGDCGLNVAQEAFAQYDRSRFKKSFFKFSDLYKSSNTKMKTNKRKPSLPDNFSVSNRTRTCDFGRQIYYFVSNKKTLP